MTFQRDEPVGQPLTVHLVEQHIRTHVPIIARGCDIIETAINSRAPANGAGRLALQVVSRGCRRVGGEGEGDRPEAVVIADDSSATSGGVVGVERAGAASPARTGRKGTDPDVRLR